MSKTAKVLRPGNMRPICLAKSRGRAWWDVNDPSIEPVITPQTKRTKGKPMPDPTFSNTYPQF